MQPILATAPNSAAPVVPARRARVHRVRNARDAATRAAGLLITTPDGLALFLKRSDKSDHPGEWCIPGGTLDPGESPEVGAVREAREETGWVAEGTPTLDKVHEAETVPGVTFTTFSVEVGNPFVPTLNDEHVGWAWAPAGKPPEPVHPGVKILVKKMVGDSRDTPEHVATIHYDGDFDLAGLVRYLHHLGAIGSSRGISVEGVGDEKKTENFEFDGDGADKIHLAVIDGKDILKEKWNKPTKDSVALDESSVRTFDADGRMHVAVTNISKACVNPYYGREIPDFKRLGLEPDKLYKLFRHPDELKKAAATFNGVPLLIKHQPATSSEHPEDLVIGATGTDAKFVAPYLRNSLVVWPDHAIDLIESDEQRELSCGYRYTPDMTPGTFKGEAYDGVMRDIVGNHVALVKEGRAGSDVAVGDAALVTADDVAWVLLEHALRGIKRRSA